MTCIDAQCPGQIAAQSTVVTAPEPSELSPLEGVIMDLCNALNDARLDGSPTRDSIRRELFAAVEAYERSGAEDHPNPKWAIPNQRALALSAAGLFDEAIETELDALDHADNARRLEISLGNLAERCIKSERYEEAVAWFLQAQEAAPGRTPILLTGTQALCLAGYVEEADAIIAAFLETPDAIAPGGELDAYLRYESRLVGLADQLPSLRVLLDRWHAAQRGIQG